jgi:cytochrome c oxidase subunit 3
MTGGHNSTLAKSKNLTLFLLFLTIILNSIFTYFQVFEYFQSSFNISDSVFGSVFFITTGLHGLHVVIGTLMAFFILLRIFLKDFTDSNHLGLWASVLYCHLVDLI